MWKCTSRIPTRIYGFLPCIYKTFWINGQGIDEVVSCSMYIVLRSLFDVPCSVLETKNQDPQLRPETKTDSWVLRPDEIIGKVVSAQRGSKSISIYGGRRGMMYASALRSIKCANLTISRILHPAYHRLAESGIFRRALRNRARPRVICFLKPNGVEMQLLMGRCMIGRCRPGLNRWWIRRPFKLFVDEDSLPENYSQGQILMQG